MLATKPLRLLVGVCLVACVATADDGDDFSNNLFSDLAPYVISVRLEHDLRKDILTV